MPRKQPHPAEPGLIPLSGEYYIDIGVGAFTTTNSEATIRTRLLQIDYSMAQAYDTYSWATDLAAEDLLSVTHAVTTGATTVTRGTGGTNSLTFSYFLIGRLSATD